MWGGVQLAIDTTLVSALGSDGNARRGASVRDGVALTEARRAKERVLERIGRPGARARLVVLALEVGGRWSAEATDFVSQLAKAKARSEPFLVRQRMEQACSWLVQRRAPSLLPCWVSMEDGLAHKVT